MGTAGKMLSLTAFFLLFTFIERVATNATPEVTIMVDPYASFAHLGETFTVNVALINVQNLYGVEVTLSWNASVLQIVRANVRLGVESYSDGVLHHPVFIAKNETIQAEGKYILAGTSTPPAASFSGSGNIAIITFNVSDVGYSKLDLETKLADWPPPERDPQISWPIAHNTVDGFFGRHVEVSVSPRMIEVNKNVTISGFIVPSIVPVPTNEVTIMCRREGETRWNNLTRVRTNDQGIYQFVWQPHETGKYEIRTVAFIGGTEEISSSAYVTVKAPEPLIWQYIIILIVVILAATVIMILIYRKKRRKIRRTERKL